MPYLQQENVVFIHIPKTGGSSVEVFFDMNNKQSLYFERWDLDRDEFLLSHKDKIPSSRLDFEPQHYTPEILEKLIPNFDDCFKFTFVRNPYTRVLSDYFWSNKISTSIEQFSPLDFDLWCHKHLSNLDDSHKIPQSEYIRGSIQFIGKFEKFESDMNRLVSKLIEFNPRLVYLKDRSMPHINATQGDKTALLGKLLPKTRQLIYKTYETDFTQLGYAG